MAKQGRCPTKPASRGKSASQLNANGQPSNGPTKPVSRGKSALQLNANEQLSNGATKVSRQEKSAWEPSENGQLKRAHETSQEKELRLRARRERAALKRQSKSPLEGVEPNRRAQSRRDSDNSRRNHRDASFAAWRILAQPRMGWPWKPRFASRRVGSRRDGSLPSLRGKPAPLSLCRLQTSMATILSCPTRGLIYLFEAPARQEAVSVIFCRQRHGSW